MKGRFGKYDDLMRCLILDSPVCHGSLEAVLLIEIEKCRSNLGIEIPEISVITESDVDPTGLCSAATVRDGIDSNSY
uniref:Uncharacterized protein n=1 Tax=Oryza glumipatula TaxID=40148 RepID=A0A0E0B8U1_9ORYZ